MSGVRGGFLSPLFHRSRHPKDRKRENRRERRKREVVEGGNDGGGIAWGGEREMERDEREREGEDLGGEERVSVAQMASSLEKRPRQVSGKRRRRNRGCGRRLEGLFEVVVAAVSEDDEATKLGTRTLLPHLPPSAPVPCSDFREPCRRWRAVMRPSEESRGEEAGNRRACSWAFSHPERESEGRGVAVAAAAGGKGGPDLGCLGLDGAQPPQASFRPPPPP